MIPKIAFGMIVFNGNYVLRQCLESVYPFAYQILIAEGPVEYWQKQGFITSTDGTSEILRSFPDPEKKITVVHGTYAEKDEQCNAYLQHLSSDAEYVWNLDSDELFKTEDIRLVMDLLQREKFTSAGFKSLSFFGDFHHCLGGFEERNEFIRIRKVYPGSRWKTHRPPTIEHAAGVTPWPEKHLDYEALAAMGVRMYHYSYVFPQQVKTKVGYYKAAVSKSNCIDNYFSRVWLPWVTGDEEVRQRIESEFDGVHEFLPAYRGDCRTYPFAGTHPIIIQRDMEQLKTEWKKQLESEMINKTCWHHPHIIPVMAACRREWGNLLSHSHGKVIKGLLDAAEQLAGRKPELVADIGCGVCPLLDLVDANHYVGIDLPANVENIRREVPGVKIVGADMMMDNPAELAKADVVVMSAFIDAMSRPLEVLERTLTQSRGLVILHRQVVYDGPTTARLSNSYLGQDTSFNSLINRKELYALFKKCGYSILSEVSAFANGDNWRSFMLVRPSANQVSYVPRTWDKPENAGPARTESLKRLVPRLFECRTALYVGASCVRFDYGEDFIKSGCLLTVLEAWGGNVEYLKKIPGITVIQGDIATTAFPDKSFEVVMWWHGPEHLAIGDLVSTIRRLEKMSSGLVVLGCPWGINPQGDLGGNPFEEHRSYLGEHLFSELGYTVECLGEPDTIGSNITAVKRMCS